MRRGSSPKKDGICSAGEGLSTGTCGCPFSSLPEPQTQPASPHMTVVGSPHSLPQSEVCLVRPNRLFLNAGQPLERPEDKHPGETTVFSFAGLITDREQQGNQSSVRSCSGTTISKAGRGLGFRGSGDSDG